MTKNSLKQMNHYNMQLNHKKIPKHRFTMSYARYVMSMHLGRDLLPDEQVDHIDNDRLNDAISNLQILTVKENNAKYTLTTVRRMVKTECPVCGVKMELPWKRTHLAKRAGSTTTCSRRCGSRAQFMELKEQKFAIFYV